MKNNVIYKSFYSVGKIVESKEVINCAFCEKEIKANQQEVVIYQESNKGFFHTSCYKDWQEIITGKILEISCSW